MSDRVVRYILTGESAGAVRAMKNVEEQSKKTESSLATTGKRMQSVGSGMASVGKSMMAVSLPFLAAGAYSIKSAMDFQKSMNLIQTGTGASEKQVKQLSKGIMEMKGVPQTPQELADSLYHTASSMNAFLRPSERVKDDLEVQKQAAIGAAIGHSNLEQTTYALVSAMNALHAPAKRAGTVMAELHGGVNAGDLRLEDLVDAMSTGYLARATTFGIGLQSANAALDTMTQKGVPAEQSATRLAMAFSLLGAPTNQAAKMLEATGLASSDVQARTQAMGEMLSKGGMHFTQLAADLRKPDGIMVALQDLKAHLEMAGLAAPEQAAFISRAFGGGKMSGGILTLYQDIPAIQANYNNELRITHEYGAAYKKVSEEAAFKWGELKREVDKTAITVGNDLLPPAMAFAKVMGGLLGDVSKLPKWMVEGMMFGAAGVAGLGALNWGIGTIGRTLGGVARLPGLLGVGGGAGGAAAADLTAAEVGGAAAGASMLGPYAAVAAAAIFAAHELHLFGENLGETPRTDKRAHEWTGKISAAQESVLGHWATRHPYAVMSGQANQTLQQLSPFNRKWVAEQLLKESRKPLGYFNVPAGPNEAGALRSLTNELIQASRVAAGRSQTIQPLVKVDLHMEGVKVGEALASNPQAMRHIVGGGERYGLFRNARSK